jgi:hypothetical protein
MGTVAGFVLTGAVSYAAVVGNPVGKMSAILPIRQDSGASRKVENTLSSGKVVPPARLERATPGLGNLPKAWWAIVGRAQRCCTVRGSARRPCPSVFGRVGP